VAVIVTAMGWPAPKQKPLIDRLNSDANYRIRVQAATSLGKRRQLDAVPALVRALNDDNELVAISAAQALGRIGDYSCIDDLKRAQQKSRSLGVTSQINVTLEMLFTLSKQDQRRSAKTRVPLPS